MGQADQRGHASLNCTQPVSPTLAESKAISSRIYTPDVINKMLLRYQTKNDFAKHIP